MSHFVIRGLTFVEHQKQILVATGVTELDIADVYLASVEWASEPENMVWDDPVTAGGLFPLDDVGEKFTGLAVRMDLVAQPVGGGNTWRVKFPDAPGPAIESRRIFGGDFLAEGVGNLPVENSANIMPFIELATSPTFVVAGGGGGITEGDKNDIAAKVWDSLLSAHNTNATFGWLVQKLLTVAKFLALK